MSLSWKRVLAALWIGIVIAGSAAGEENWTSFRGPTDQGHNDAGNLPLRWSEKENVVWKRPIAGKAWSSPVIWGDRIWLTHAPEEGTQLSVVCVDKNSGKIVSSKQLRYVPGPQYCHPFNSYASPSPVLEEGRVYVSFGAPYTGCLDSQTGKVLWERTDLVCNHFRGAGSSPIIYKDLLILHFDGSRRVRAPHARGCGRKSHGPFCTAVWYNTEARSAPSPGHPGRMSALRGATDRLLERTMSSAGIPQPLRGIIPPMVTPLADRESLDLPGVERLVEHILSAEVAGLFILGTCGEGPSLSYRLRQELIEVVSERVGGRVPLLVGVSDSALAESVAIAEFAADAGAQAVVLAPPYYHPARQDEIARHVEQFAAESPLPVFLYNLPGHTKIALELDTLRRLIEAPNIVGLKDSSANMIYFHNVRRLARQRPEWTLLVGPEELLAESVLFGGDGGVCGGANLLPRLYVDLYHAARRGDLAGARQLHDDVMRISTALYTIPGHGAPVITGLKGVLACWGMCGDLLAEPFGPLSDEHRRQIRQRLERLGADWVQAPAAHPA